MVRFFRRFRRLNLFVFALFRRRVRALARSRYAYLALLLVVAVPVSWHGLAGSDRYLGPWILLTSALILVGLRGRVPRGRNVRRSSAAGFFWLGTAACVIGLINTALFPVLQKSIPQATPIPWLDGTISVIEFSTVWMASIYITVLAGRFLLLYFSRLLAVVSFRGRTLGKKLSPGNLYGVLLALVAILISALVWENTWDADDPSEFLIITSIVLLGFALPFVNRQKPWDRTAPLAFSIFAHIFVIYIVSVLIMILIGEGIGLKLHLTSGHIRTKTSADFWLSVFITGYVGSIGYWVLHSLRIPLSKRLPAMFEEPRFPYIPTHRCTWIMPGTPRIWTI